MKVGDKVEVTLIDGTVSKGKIQAIELIVAPATIEESEKGILSIFPRTVSGVSISVVHESGTTMSHSVIPIEIREGGIIKRIRLTPIDKHYCCSAEINALVFGEGTKSVSCCKIAKNPYNITFE